MRIEIPKWERSTLGSCNLTGHAAPPSPFYYIDLEANCASQISNMTSNEASMNLLNHVVATKIYNCY